MYSTGCTNKADARRVCDRLLAEGMLGKRSPTVRGRLGGFWDEDSPYVTYQRQTSRLSERYRAMQARILERDILPKLGDKRIDELTPADVREWLLDFEKPKAGNRALKCLRVMFHYLETEREILHSPTNGVRFRKVEKLVRGIPTRAEARKLLDPERWPDWFPNRAHYALSLTAATTGMRLSEILRLTSEAVHDTYIEVKKTKTGYDRIAPALPEVVEILRKEIPFKMGARNASAYFRRALEAAKIPDYDARNISFHSWRHYFNTQLQAAGVGDGVLRAVIGHRSEAMTVNYSKFLAEHYGELSGAQRWAVFGEEAAS